MNRLLYFTGYRMRLLIWDGKQFDGEYSFEPDTDGYAKFETYLASSAKSPVRLLVDVIEEDYRIETVPRVFGKDRRAVINRLVDRFYRSSRDFTYSEIIGREKSGRKDYRVLLSALTNPGLLTRWLEIIEQVGVPLSGVWTLPIVSKAVLPSLDAKSGPVLLVSQQVNSNLRQTFFRDGRMINSRQSVINQDSSDITRIGEYAKPEVDRTILYLRSQDYIRDDEVLDVHMIVSDEQVGSIEQHFGVGARESFSVHRVSDIEHKTGVRGYGSRFSDGIYAWLCMKQPPNSGHYDSGAGKDRYHFSIMSAAFYAASICLLVLGLLMAESYISDALQYDKAAALLKDQEREYRRLYQEKFESYEEVFANAGVMNAAVDLAHQIERHGQVTPLDLYLELSKVMRDSGLEDVTIDSISWRSHQVSEVKGKPEPVVSDVSMISGDEVRHAAVIKGRLAISRNNYSESVDRIQDIIDALQQHERVVTAEAIDMPVEVRSEKKFSAESGISKGAETGDVGVFSLRVVMRGKRDV